MDVGNDGSSSSFSVNNFDLNVSPVSHPSNEDIEEAAPNSSNISSFSSNIFTDQCGNALFLPDVEADQKPVVGTFFVNYDATVNYYTEYAKKAGFSVRRSTVKYNKKSTNRYVLCNKAGVPRNKVSYNSLNPPEKKRRVSNFKVTDCKARICLKGAPNSESYTLVNFVEGHNHCMLDDADKHLSRPNRQLELADKEFIHNLSKSNIGPTKAHRIHSLLKGGPNKLHGTVVDYKNFRRDVNKYVGNRDAQMLVEKFEARKCHVPNFTFEYEIVDSELHSVFWADEISKYNYEIYGDVLAFDATYDTNLYGMVFVPFTGVDNHGRCVTFGAGLLKNEAIDSYKWILESFLKAHKKQPKLVFTDQDAAVKQAIPLVFPDAFHRLCMWHIMRKLPGKISGDLLQNTDIRKRLNKLVWNVFLSCSEFEDKWKLLINDFNLGDHQWLSDMYKIRERWIPAYFRDIPMCCLMKSTSRSESENSFFSIYSSPGNNLIQFLNCFETAMEKQRHDKRISDNLSSTTVPSYATEFEIERYAASVYTRSKFGNVQKEIIRSVWSCIQKSVVEVEGSEICTILHKNKDGIVVAEFKVVLKDSVGSISCECDNFTRHGYPCCHMFYVWNSHGIQKIPQEFLLKRWTMNILPLELSASYYKYGLNNLENEKLCSDAFSIVDLCVALLRSNTEKFSLFVETLKGIKSELEKELPEESQPESKESVIKRLLGVESPKEVLIKVPQGIRNKGSGTKKRLVGPSDKAKDKSKKKAKRSVQSVDKVKDKLKIKSKKKGKKKLREGTYRTCWTCEKVVNDHDTRNCPTKEVEEDDSEEDDSEEDDSEEDEEEYPNNEDFESSGDSGDDADENSNDKDDDADD